MKLSSNTNSTEQGKFTVFCSDGYWPSGNTTGMTLEALIEHAVKSDPAHPPLAWAAEAVSVYGGTKGYHELHVESIAAGRIVELVDGRYVARGVARPAPAAPTTIPFERPRTQREAEWMLRQAMAKDVAEAAAREAEARRCAPLPACDGLLRLAPMR